MARRRKMDPERKAFISSLLEHYQPKDAQDIQEMLKDLLGDTLQSMLEAEMDEHLGYSKYDYQNKETDDSRNGYSPKTVTSTMGTINLEIPRDRQSTFQPEIVKKNQTDISNIEDQVLSMYAKGMTTRDISSHLRDVYGVEASAEMISHMTDRIRTEVCDCIYGCRSFSCSRRQSYGKKSRICCDWCKIKRKTRSSWHVDWWK